MSIQKKIRWLIMVLMMRQPWLKLIRYFFSDWHFMPIYRLPFEFGIAAAAMAFLSISVVLNALLMKRYEAKII